MRWLKKQQGVMQGVMKVVSDRKVSSNSTKIDELSMIFCEKVLRKKIEIKGRTYQSQAGENKEEIKANFIIIQ